MVGRSDVCYNAVCSSDGRLIAPSWLFLSGYESHLKSVAMLDQSSTSDLAKRLSQDLISKNESVQEFGTFHESATLAKATGPQSRNKLVQLLKALLDEVAALLFTENMVAAFLLLGQILPGLLCSRPLLRWRLNRGVTMLLRT